MNEYEKRYAIAEKLKLYKANPKSIREIMYDMRHRLRALGRIANCPNPDWFHEWQGGWCDGAPDGGDTKKVCMNCNLFCTEEQSNIREIIG